MATSAYGTALFPAFYDAMVASLPPEFEVAEAHSFYTSLALKLPPDSPATILDLCTGTGSIPRAIAAAWESRAAPLRITGVDNSEEMLKAARAAWPGFPNVDAEWMLATLGHRGALADLSSVNLVIISAGSIHHLATRADQLQALQESHDALRGGGTLVLNVFPVEEILGELAPNDYNIWRLNDGFWKQTVKKEVATVADGGATGTETFRIGCERWSEEAVCEWTLRSIPWDDVRAVCAQVGFKMEHEFASFRDALAGKSADAQEAGTSGRIFLLRKLGC